MKKILILLALATAVVSDSKQPSEPPTWGFYVSTMDSYWSHGASNQQEWEILAKYRTHHYFNMLHAIKKSNVAESRRLHLWLTLGNEVKEGLVTTCIVGLLDKSASIRYLASSLIAKASITSPQQVKSNATLEAMANYTCRYGDTLVAMNLAMILKYYPSNDSVSSLESLITRLREEFRHGQRVVSIAQINAIEDLLSDVRGSLPHGGLSREPAMGGRDE